MEVLIGILIAILVGAVGFYFLSGSSDLRKRPAHRDSENEEKESTPPSSRNRSGGGGHKKSAVAAKIEAAKSHKKAAGGATEKATHNPLYVDLLKGFAGEIACVAIDRSGLKVMVAASDRSLRVFYFTSSPSVPGATPAYTRVNIVGDEPTACDFTYNGDQGICALNFTKELHMYKFEQGEQATLIRKSKVPAQTGRVRWLYASRGEWVVTCSEEKDTDINIWDYSFNIVRTINPKQVENYFCHTSLLDGRFFAVSAWSPGVKLTEIVSKNGALVKIQKAMDLTSRCGTCSTGFSPDHKYGVVFAKDSTVTLWNINVRYTALEDPHKILEVTEEDPRMQNVLLIAFAANGERFAAVAGANLAIYKTETLTIETMVENAHTCPIDCIAASPNGDYFITGGADHRPRIWKWTH